MIVLPLLVFHAPILRGIANVLVVNEPTVVNEQNAGPVDALAFRHDPETLAAAAHLVQAGRATKVLLVPFEPRRTDLLGVTPREDDDARRELIAAGVAESAIEMLPGPAIDSWDQAERLAEFLRAEPARRVIVVTPRFQGRYIRRIVVSTLSEAERGRVGFASEPPTSFDEQRYWTVRYAFQRVVQGYVLWGHVAAVGRPTVHHGRIDFEKFDAAVARGEKP